jgi:WD domain, G-beta repeat
MAAGESVVASIQKPKIGRTLYDAIDLQTADGSDQSTELMFAPSSLNHPVLILPKIKDKLTNDVVMDSMNHAEQSANNILIRSSYRQVSRDAADAVRRYLDARLKFENVDGQGISLKRSLDFNRNSLAKLIQQRNILLSKQSQIAVVPTVSEFNGNANEQVVDFVGSSSSQQYCSSPKSLLTELDEIDYGEQNCKRVIAQLERQLPGLMASIIENSSKLNVAKKEALYLFEKHKRVLRCYRDPVPNANGSEKYSSNRLLLNLQARQLGHFDRLHGRTIPRSMGRVRTMGMPSENQKCLLYNRFSYSATINSHLHYPVYCLRFDRTGRYFITGADDYLVRVFCLGKNIAPKKRQLDRSTYTRGAVLVCTLKGHAGVVNDICVSSDNSFLATASEDGDCRVWGLKDGCPVAILRGHHGGANMVRFRTRMGMCS